MPDLIQAKTILNTSKQRDPWFLGDYSLNPFSGCSFNCLYCYIRGSKYGINMTDSLAVKENAPELLDRKLKNLAAKGRFGIIVLSSATDPYLQFEKELNLTRSLLEIILAHRFPVHIITKSDLIIRDFDLLRQIGEAAILPSDLGKKLSNGVLVTFSFSTIDDAVADVFEPGAVKPSARLLALQQAAHEGFKTGVSMMPMLPYITDTTQSLSAMFEAFVEGGAHYVMPATITLFGRGKSDSKTLVMRAVEKHYPHLLARYQKYFEQANALPAFYQKAFHIKMKEMAEQYKMPNRIIY